MKNKEEKLSYSKKIGRKIRENFKKQREEESVFITRDVINNMVASNIALLYDDTVDTIIDAMKAIMDDEERFEYDINNDYIKSHVTKFYNTLTSTQDINYEREKFLDKIYKRVINRDSLIIYRI